MLAIKNIHKKYVGAKALNGVSLMIPRGEVVGLFGENGAGKTTLMKCILNYLCFDGEITLDGEKINRKNITKISFATCEHSFFPDMTALGHKSFYRKYFDGFREKRFDGLMKFFDLPEHKPIRKFSAGQKSQFEVILALSQGADYILMDEPFVGNDVFNREDFYKVLVGILEPEETILLSTHLIEEVSGFVGRAIFLRKGELIGDVCMADLEETGKSLTDYVKECYGYRPDRVSKALQDILNE